MKMEGIVNKLIILGKTISTMESCTGGYIANNITNISGSSEIFKFGAVTYSNLFKIKMGVSSDIIDRYSVYSMDTADCMAKAIVNFTDSDYGVGITGKLNREDVNNLYGEDNIVFISVYDKEEDKYYHKEIRVSCKERFLVKEDILDEVILLIKECIKKA